MTTWSYGLVNAFIQHNTYSVPNEYTNHTNGMQARIMLKQNQQQKSNIYLHLHFSLMLHIMYTGRDTIACAHAPPNGYDTV